MRALTALLCAICYCAVVADVFPQGGEPNVISNSSASIIPQPASTKGRKIGIKPQKAKSGRLTSVQSGDAVADKNTTEHAENPHAEVVQAAAPAQGVGQGAKQKSIPSPASPAPAIDQTPDPDELEGPHIEVTEAPKPPMAMVHSENPLDSAHTVAHTMRPGDSILTAGVDPLASSLLLGMGGPAARPLPSKPTPAIHGATFAVGGATYTASMDQNLNIVVGTSILKPGGAAATLGGGAAIVSVVPGGALVVDGGTLTMSAIHPPITGAVVNLGGRIVTATQTTGASGKLLVVGSATMTAGGPAATAWGQRVSFGPDGLAMGGLVAAISTMTYNELTTPAPVLTDTRVSGFARFSGSMKPNTTTTILQSDTSSNRIPWAVLLVEGIITTVAWFLSGG